MYALRPCLLSRYRTAQNQSWMRSVSGTVWVKIIRLYLYVTIPTKKHSISFTIRPILELGRLSKMIPLQVMCRHRHHHRHFIQFHHTIALRCASTNTQPSRSKNADKNRIRRAMFGGCNRLGIRSEHFLFLLCGRTFGAGVSIELDGAVRCCFAWFKVRHRTDIKEQSKIETLKPSHKPVETAGTEKPRETTSRLPGSLKCIKGPSLGENHVSDQTYWVIACSWGSLRSDNAIMGIVVWASWERPCR